MKNLKKGNEVVGLAQNTPAWHRWRDGSIENNIFRLGGSDAAVVMGVNAWTNVNELYERKLGLLPPIEMNEAMARGHRLEPTARVEFEFDTGIHVRPACYTHADYDWMAASLDGISYDGTIIVEIKCPGLKTHSEAMKGTIPAYYLPQIQHQLAVTGAEKAFYFSYTDIPNTENVLIEILPDEEYIARLIERERLFIECLKNRTPPPSEIFGVGDVVRDNTERNDPLWRSAIAEWKKRYAVAMDALRQFDAGEQEIIRLMQKKKQITACSDGVFVERKLQENGEWILNVQIEGEDV